MQARGYALPDADRIRTKNNMSQPMVGDIILYLLFQLSSAPSFHAYEIDPDKIFPKELIPISY